MNVDQLTQLPNRHQFNNHLQDEINKYEHTKAKFSLLIIDLDQFKSINDGLGYEVGDELLKIAVYRILNVINNNGFVARMSGDEFSILLYNMTDAGRTHECLVFERYG
jgi:diguanylate cyclase (GGDEF)-like protein